MDDENRAPAISARSRQPAIASADAASGALVRCGAELVELSERFYHGLFVGVVAFVGAAGVAALALLPLRVSDAGYTTITVIATSLLVAAVPFAVGHAHALYLLLRRSEAARLVVVLLAASLVVHPLRSELWWPSCALLMVVSTLVPLRQALVYCLVVLLANLAAHAVARDFDETPPTAIIGLWIGYIYWCSACAVFTDRFVAYVLHLNRPAMPPKLPPLRVHPAQPSATAEPHTGVPQPAQTLPSEAGGPDPDTPRDGATGLLTARQLQVVALLADGLRYDEIAACLAISERQVQRHVSNATARLGLRNAHHLTAVAVAEGLVPAR